MTHEEKVLWWKLAWDIFSCFMSLISCLFWTMVFYWVCTHQSKTDQIWHWMWN